MKTPRPTVGQLATRLEAQAVELASLRAELALQFTRIAQLQAGLDLSHAQRRRQTAVAVSTAASHQRRERRRD